MVKKAASGDNKIGVSTGEERIMNYVNYTTKT